MSQQQMYLDGRYVENNPTYHVEDSPWKARQIVRMLGRHQLRVRSVCEVGCGAAEVLRQLQQHLPGDTIFHGYEISPQAFTLCQQRANDRLHVYCEDLLARPTAPYDLLLCLDVIEHIDDYLGALRRLRDKATYKLFHIPLDMTVQGVLRRSPITVSRSAAGHLHYFMKETALMALSETGYEVVDWLYTPCGDQGTTFRSKLARWPRRLCAWLAPDWTARVLGGYSLLVLAK